MQKKTPGSRTYRRASRRETSARRPFTRLLPELLKIHDQATERAAEINQVALPPASAQKKPWGARPRLEFVLNVLIECRSLLTGVANQTLAQNNETKP